MAKQKETVHLFRLVTSTESGSASVLDDRAMCNTRSGDIMISETRRYATCKACLAHPGHYAVKGNKIVKLPYSAKYGATLTAVVGK